MNSIIEGLRDSLVVSCQAFPDEPLYGADIMAKMAVAAVLGGAKGIRACWPEMVAAIKAKVSVPIIGINKVQKEGQNVRDDVIITPTLEAAIAISEAGADIIAIDGTLRNRTIDDLASLVNAIKATTGKPMMADISTLDEAILAAHLGFDIVSTTLSGYTSYSRQGIEPDLELIAAIKNEVDVPINAEGRFFESKDIRKAFDLGAWCMTIGGAITRPALITKHYIDAIKSN